MTTNNVGASQEVQYVQNAKKNLPAAQTSEALPNSVNATQVSETGKGVEIQSQTDFNLYGKNFENFEKFKGNDKHDAMRMTQTAANDVKKAYMQLQHEFPDVVIVFEPMPDPKACGKKREGFFTYQQQLNDWKDTAIQKINNTREFSTKEVVIGTASAVMANDNKNAALNAGVTAAYGEANLGKTLEQGEKTREVVQQEGTQTRKAVHNEGAATRRTVRNEGVKTRAVVRQEGQETRDEVYKQGVITRNLVRMEGVITRDAVHSESTITRNTVRAEGAKTRNATRLTAQQTQELNGISEKITVNLANGSYHHTQDTMDKVNNMRNKILQSNIPFEAKKEAITHLAAFSTQRIMSDRELSNEQKRIDKMIDSNPSTLDEIPEMEFPLFEESPLYESTNKKPDEKK